VLWLGLWLRKLFLLQFEQTIFNQSQLFCNSRVFSARKIDAFVATGSQPRDFLISQNDQPIYIGRRFYKRIFFLIHNFNLGFHISVVGGWWKLNCGW